MSEHLVLDVETKYLLENKPLHMLEVSCAVTYSFTSDRYNVYGDTAGELEDLKSRLLKASRITTWGGWTFDLPVIWKLPLPQKVSQLAKQSDDMRRKVYTSQQLDPDHYDPQLYAGWSLDAVSRATLGVEGKSGSGSGAPALYHNRQWGRLVDYCLNDVKLTRDLCMFGDKYGYVHGAYGMYAKIERWV